jgi:hypothetical protein
MEELNNKRYETYGDSNDDDPNDDVWNKGLRLETTYIHQCGDKWDGYAPKNA